VYWSERWLVCCVSMSKGVETVAKYPSTLRDDKVKQRKGAEVRAKHMSSRFEG
jgi:hypothetical protein